MKFKKLAKVIDHKFIRVTVKMSDRWVKICDSTTGLSNDFIKTYGEYEVDSIEDMEEINTLAVAHSSI